MPKKNAKRAKEYLREQAKLAQPASTASFPAHQKHRRRRLTDGLIGLSSAAILSVYGLGYFHTQASGADLSIDSVLNTPTPAPTRVGQTPGPSPITAGYRDGTYKATGTSRHGDVQATIVISGGKITSAKVTGCNTRYPCSDVNPLVSEVVSRQGAPVHYVSGATDSSRAYIQAVKLALQQAS
jgi:uncharacterized protein with FMN-binding domain